MPLLRAHQLSKAYAGVPALAGVDFDLRPGEVHALVGENGAGKSTMLRILAGLLPPTSGSMTLRGQPYAPARRRDAERAGVRMVLQELNLIPTLSVAENLFLDALPRRLGWLIDRAELRLRAERAMDEVGLTGIDPDAPLASLGVGQCQLVEIARVLAAGRCDVLLLDEPTAALTDAEAQLLFAQVRRLKEAGAGIVYVSHRMEEVRAISDRITVLRDGRRVETLASEDAGHDRIVRLMVGRDLPSAGPRPAPNRSTAPLLSVRGLRAGRAVRDVSFDLFGGEVLGLAGLMGSGRTETLRALFAADPPDAGQVFLRGSSVPTRIRSPRHAVTLGMALVTEDRKGQGLLLPLGVRENLVLSSMARLGRALGLADRRAERAATDRSVASLGIRCRSIEQPVVELSGGNQQKVVLARWLLRDADILLLDEPTRGIDVGAKFEVYQLLADLAARGKGVLVVSSDLPELMAICDRIAVMSAGRLVATFPRGDWSEDHIMTAALSGYVRPDIERQP